MDENSAILYPYIQKTNLFYTADMFYPKYRGISQGRKRGGTDPDSQTERKRSVRWVLKKGQHLKHIIESWSKGQGEPDAFILRITDVTC